MRPDEYRHLADSTRRRGYVEQSALRAQWEILAWEISAATYRVDAAADALRASSKRTSEGATSIKTRGRSRELSNVCRSLFTLILSN
jgi:hypothetical protein